MFSLLTVGFLIGLRHALEADHVMAVATLTADKNRASAIGQGIVWGVGHTLTLLVVGGVVLFADSLIPAQVANSLEMLVGVMLMILGADLIRRVMRDKWHIHPHKHADGRRHLHLHKHVGTASHDASAHQHVHHKRLPLRALLVGIMHGFAGSAALVLLTLQTVQSPLIGIFYIVVFGVGSIAGMALLSFCIAVPLNMPALNSVRVRNALSCTIGAFTLTLGAYTVYHVGVVNSTLLT